MCEECVLCLKQANHVCILYITILLFELNELVIFTCSKILWFLELVEYDQ